MDKQTNKWTSLSKLLTKSHLQVKGNKWYIQGFIYTLLESNLKDIQAVHEDEVTMLLRGLGRLMIIFPI